MCHPLIVVPVFYYSCTAIPQIKFSKDLRSDTIMLSADIETRQDLTDTYYYMGPYFIRFGKNAFDSRRKKTVSSTRAEDNLGFKFIVCVDSVCVYSLTNIYQKTKTTSVTPLYFLGKEPVTFVKYQKLEGYISYGIEPAKLFHVRTIGKKNGYGFMRVSENSILSVRPIKKTTKYGMKPFAVALEFTLDNKVICSFIQEDGQIKIAMKKGIDEKHRLLLITLCLSLMSK